MYDFFVEVLLGSASEKCADLINFAHDTQHEKIIRGIAIGLALIMYGREEEADALISQLTTDKDPILRYGGMFAIGLAYCGTANNNAIRSRFHTSSHPSFIHSFVLYSVYKREKTHLREIFGDEGNCCTSRCPMFQMMCVVPQCWP
jgi:hypothetical protein